MMSIIEDKYGRGLIAPIRPEQIDPKAQQINYFPLDAFEFTNPSNTTAPVLRMKEPWSFDVPALTLDGQSTATWATVPGEAWYMGLYSIASRYFILGDSPQTTLDIASFDAGLAQTSTGVKGGITLDLSGYTDWSVSFKWAGTWQWVTSSTVGSKNGPWVWDGVAEELYIYSGLPYHLPFTLRDNLEIISDMLLFESVKSDEYMSGLLSGKSRLGIDGENINSAGNVIIDGDGFRWYGGGDASIILGETAEFNNVTVQGNYEAGVSGWRIDADGNVEFNDGTFRGRLSASNLITSSQVLDPPITWMSGSSVSASDVETVVDGYDGFRSAYGIINDNVFNVIRVFGLSLGFTVISFYYEDSIGNRTFLGDDPVWTGTHSQSVTFLSIPQDTVYLNAKRIISSGATHETRHTDAQILSATIGQLQSGYSIISGSGSLTLTISNTTLYNELKEMYDKAMEGSATVQRVFIRGTVLFSGAKYYPIVVSSLTTAYISLFCEDFTELRVQTGSQSVDYELYT